jgi:Ceramidase
LIDFYCERTDPGLLAEPFNTLTNLAFLIAAWRAWVLGRDCNALTLGIRLLIALLISIAIGSALYHVFATGWARVLDLVPILLFQFCYLWLYSRWLMGFGIGAAVGSMVGLFASVHIAQQFPHILNGSLIYAPALILLVGLGLYHFRSRKRGQRLLLTATGLFLISLFFRTVDRGICLSFPVGTHFVWHLLNGVILYLVMRAVLLNRTNSFEVK